MSPLVAYFLGLLTFLVIFLPFWALALINSNVGEAFDQVFCTDLANEN